MRRRHHHSFESEPVLLSGLRQAAMQVVAQSEKRAAEGVEWLNKLWASQWPAATTPVVEPKLPVKKVIKAAAVEKSEKLPLVLALGGPGSGKGTQCTQLAQEFGFAHISTGELLRNEVVNGTALGREVISLLSTGQLVPDELVLRVLQKAIDALPKTTRGVLVDGFPRSLQQAKLFVHVLGSPHLILYFHCPGTVLKRRLTHRGRADDKDAVIEKRIKQHYAETTSVLNFFKHHASQVAAGKDGLSMADSNTTVSVAQPQRFFAMPMRRQQNRSKHIIRIPSTPPREVVYQLVRNHFLPGASFDQGRATGPLGKLKTEYPSMSKDASKAAGSLMDTLKRMRNAIQLHPSTTMNTPPIGRPIPMHTHASPLYRPVVVPRPRMGGDRPHAINPRYRMGQTLTTPFYLSLLHMSTMKTLMRRMLP
ncbi:adenylate kinase-domain-containing protein [Phlyctochytrium arcticum]|nr:adenylate kinase-domain-containing protein [Phlyctochytrium arcticum]